MSRPAGSFDRWLIATDRALRTNSAAEVPCGDCTACCRSSQFIHITAQDRSALATIDPELLVRAPGGIDEFVLGFDEHGACPMLKAGACSIYEARPQACRAYDCRIFPATGVRPDQPPIRAAVAAWVFDLENSTLEPAVKRAAAWLSAHAHRLDLGRPLPEVQLALYAIKIHDEFIDEAEPDLDRVRARLASSAR